MNDLISNKDVALKFNLLGKLLELHGENPFRTRSYSSAYITIRKLPTSVITTEKEDLLQIKGIGKAIADKIVELRETGEIKTLTRYLEKTPPGIVEMLQMKGFGPKKIKVIWEQMGIETPGELLYACEENRLVDLKGFGAKTQQSLKQQLEFFLDSQGKYLLGHIESAAYELRSVLQQEFKEGRIEFINGLRRLNPIVDGIEILSSISSKEIIEFLTSEELINPDLNDLYYQGIRIVLNYCPLDKFNSTWFKLSASSVFIEEWTKNHTITEESDAAQFAANGFAFIPPELRESAEILNQASKMDHLDLIRLEDIKGVIHTHSTYSDGTATVEAMAQSCMDLGYDYLVMSDHSKAAFYANGLTEDRVLQQMNEIDILNAQNDSFRIFKSIECDILYDGSLDYSDDFLSHFDLVIASVHSNLKMTEEKAMQRLLNAIAHPAVTILGHPTGRLLLSREGYPIDHVSIIDACAQHNVAIELNASPYRLDLDWQWISYAQKKGVLVSINPDAHSIEGIKDIKYGVYAARKGGLGQSHCLNAMGLREFSEWIKEHKAC